MASFVNSKDNQLFLAGIRPLSCAKSKCLLVLANLIQMIKTVGDKLYALTGGIPQQGACN
jgi:hypothetical protein